MTDLRTAAQQALAALVRASSYYDTYAEIAALEAALAEPDLFHCPKCGGPADNGHDRSIPPSPYWCTKCMAEPVQEPVAWVECDGDLVWNNREAAIGRNLYTSPPPQQTEPSQDTPPQHEYEVTANDDGTFSVGLPDGEELRIIPPQRKPLTEGEIDSIWDSEKVFPDIYAIVRAIERAHGIT